MFWSRPPVPSKQVLDEVVQVPPVSGSPATSAPSLSPEASAAPTVFRWSVHTAPIVPPLLGHSQRIKGSPHPRKSSEPGRKVPTSRQTYPSPREIRNKDEWRLPMTKYIASITS